MRRATIFSSLSTFLFHKPSFGHDAACHVCTGDVEASVHTPACQLLVFAANSVNDNNGDECRGIQYQGVTEGCCDTPVGFCNLCEKGGNLPNPDELASTLSCAEVGGLASFLPINDVECVDFQATYGVYCGCDNPIATESIQCNLCQNRGPISHRKEVPAPQFQFDANTPVNRFCGLLEYFAQFSTAPLATCAAYQDAFAEVCCEALTDGPTTFPTLSPTMMQTTAEPTMVPTAVPTISPTAFAPTHLPTVSPTEAPSGTPVTSPTELPADAPTENPVVTPTVSAVVLTGAPVLLSTDVRTESPLPHSDIPIVSPNAARGTAAPVVSTTIAPVVSVTGTPAPTDAPIVAASEAPFVPTGTPVLSSTDAPIVSSSEDPIVPIGTPVLSPTDAPIVSFVQASMDALSEAPSVSFDDVPTNSPVANSTTSVPLDAPVVAPTISAVDSPTEVPRAEMNTSAPFFPIPTDSFFISFTAVPVAATMKPPIAPMTEAPVVVPTDAPLVDLTEVPVSVATDTPVATGNTTETPMVVTTKAPAGGVPTKAPFVPPTDSFLISFTSVSTNISTPFPTMTDNPLPTSTDVPLVSPSNAPEVTATTSAPFKAMTLAPISLQPVDTPEDLSP